MTRKLLLLPVVGLVILAGYLGLNYGQPVSETEAINVYATQYSIVTARPMSDCSAIPSTRDGTWIEVVCIGDDLTGTLYLVAPNGSLQSTVDIKAPQL